MVKTLTTFSTEHAFNTPREGALGTQDPRYLDFYRTFRQREDAITLMHQLNGLTIAVQKHRGISMGLIGGNNVFEGNFTLLQAQFERRLSTLEVFAKDSKLLTKRDKQSLHQAWTTISDDWQDDDIDVNFELHSHFIEQLLAMTWKLAHCVGGIADTSVTDESVLAMSRVGERTELLTFVAKNLPQIIELIGKVRGLSTYSAAAGSVSETHEKKLRFLLSCIREQCASLRGQAKNLDKTVEGVLTALTGFKDIELKLNYFLNTVEKDLLSGLPEKADSSKMFGLATELIDKYWVVVNQGLSLLRQWQGEEMELWLRR